jgi:DeoR/GlpR family transcriptional regulator of sugar metabolism
MNHMQQQTTYTTQQAAQQLRVSDSRIRQILMDQQNGGIGRKHGTAWILTEDDVHRIGLRVGKKSKSPLA